MPRTLAKTIQENLLQQDKFKHWQKLSNCWWMKYVVGAEVDLFPNQATKQAEIAVSMCAGCPTQVECLTLAITSKEEYGVWGGTTEAERKELILRIYAEHEDIPRSIWNEELGETISRFAELNVDAFNTRNGIDDSLSEQLIQDRLGHLASLEQEF